MKLLPPAHNGSADENYDGALNEQQLRAFLDRLRLSRRDLFKVTGGGIGAGLLYGLQGKGLHLGLPEATTAFAMTPEHTVVSALRPRDLLALNFKLFNLSRVNDDLVVTDIAKPAYLVVEFPGQHIGEEAFFESAPNIDPSGPSSDDPSPSQAAKARIADKSQLAFLVPPNAKIPYNLESLLDWTQFRLSVAPAALPPDAQGCVSLERPPLTLRLFWFFLNIPVPAFICVGAPEIREPLYNETAIEAPWALTMSPHERAGWAHSRAPVELGGRTELWHTRLGVRKPVSDPQGSPVANPDGSPKYEVDEESADERTLRAIWADGFPGLGTDPSFRMSLLPRDRQEFVRLTSDFTISGDGPKAIQANRLMLSSLGAWIDTRGAWDPQGVDGLTREEWVHQATMGRDQYVRVVTKGYLFPFGHRVSLIKVTERKFFEHPGPEIVAYLRQRIFIVVREPEKSYDISDAPGQESAGRGMPFKKVRITTRKTPNLDKPELDKFGTVTDAQDSFWPRVGGNDFQFHLIGEDADGQRTEFTAPLAFVDQAISADSFRVQERISLYNDSSFEQRRARKINGQRVAYAPSTPGKRGNTTLETAKITFSASPPADPAAILEDQPLFFPKLLEAEVRLAAVEQASGSPLPGTEPTIILLTQKYLEQGFGPPDNEGQVYAKLKTSKSLAFPTNKSGGIATPNMQIIGISRVLGPVGGRGGSATVPFTPTEGDIGILGTGLFDPAEFLGTQARILGAILLSNIVKKVPDFQVGGRADKVPQITAREIFPGIALANAGFESGTSPWTSGGSNTLDASTDQAKFGFQSGKMTHGSSTTFYQYPVTLPEATEYTVRVWLYIPTSWNGGQIRLKRNDFAGADGDDETAADMSTSARDEWQQLVLVFRPHPDDRQGEIRIEGDSAPSGVAASKTLYLDSLEIVESLALPEALETTLFWNPDLQPDPLDIFQPWLDDGAPSDPTMPADFRLSGQFLAKLNGEEATFSIVGSLDDFKVNLIGDDPPLHFITIKFTKLAFTAKSGQKPNVDVDILDVSFHGVLSLVNELQKFLGAGGFAINISIAGIKAGYTRSLPDTTIGVFALRQMAISADVNIPFTNKPVRFRFCFSSRENPFQVSVNVATGGGFFCIGIGLDGVELFEMAIEFGARIAFDVGVASGSVEIMGGFYFKIEAISPPGQQQLTFTAYLRMSGEVCIIGIITISVEFYLGLTYKNPPDILIGEASLKVKIKIIFFSKTVTLRVRRQLPASTHEVTFEDLMAEDDWLEYVDAFASVP